MNVAKYNTSVGVPHDLESEKAVLGGILRFEEQLRRISSLIEPEYFFLPAHRSIYKEMLILMTENASIDEITLADKLANKNLIDEIGGFAYIAELREIWSTHGNIEQYCRILKEHFLTRELIRLAGDITQKSREASSDANTLLAEFLSKLNEISQSGVEKRYIHIQAAVDESLLRMKVVSKDRGEISGLETGFVDLDKITSGFQPSDLIIVAARPSMGKTAFALNIASYVGVHLRKNVIFFSLEMSQSQIADRLLASEGNVDSSIIRNGNLDGDDYEKIARAVATFKTSGLYINDTAGLTVFEMSNIATQLHHHLQNEQGNGLNLLIVDYLQLLRPVLKHQNREQEISEISRSIKSLAKDLNIPVVALSQLNRSLESRKDKRPLMSDIRESGSIEQDADLISFIYRDEVYNKETDDQGIAEVLLEKHRNGATGMVKLGFTGKYARFTNHLGPRNEYDSQ